MRALLVVDMQNDFCHPDGALARRGTDVGGMPEAAEVSDRLADAFRGNGGLVIFARTEHGEWTDSPTWRTRIKAEGKDVDTIPVCATEWGAALFGVTPTESDRVIVKHRYSAFYGTDLDIVLRAKAIKGLYVTGVLTNVCVESTVRDGFMRDYDMTVVPEGCTANTAAEHDMALHNMATYFGAVRTLPDVLSELRDPARVSEPQGATGR